METLYTLGSMFSKRLLQLTLLVCFFTVSTISYGAVKDFGKVEPNNPFSISSGVVYIKSTPLYKTAEKRTVLRNLLYGSRVVIYNETNSLYYVKVNLYQYGYVSKKAIRPSGTLSKEKTTSSGITKFNYYTILNTTKTINHAINSSAYFGNTGFAPQLIFSDVWVYNKRLYINLDYVLLNKNGDQILSKLENPFQDTFKSFILYVLLTNMKTDLYSQIIIGVSKKSSLESSQKVKYEQLTLNVKQLNEKATARIIENSEVLWDKVIFDILDEYSLFKYYPN